jgi:hypothetical protein
MKQFPHTELIWSKRLWKYYPRPSTRGAITFAGHPQADTVQLLGRESNPVDEQLRERRGKLNRTA